MVRVLLLKADEFGIDPAHQLHEQAVEIDEGLVPVFGDGQPRVAVSGRKPRPAPLARVPILIADEKIDESRLEIGARINSFAGRLFKTLVQLVRAAHLAGSGKSRLIVGRFGRMFLQGADQPGKLLAIRSQPRIVGDYHQPMRRVQDSRRLHQRIHH